MMDRTSMGMRARSSPVRVRDVLVSAVPELRDRLLEETIRKSWARVVGPQFASWSRPGTLKMGALDVRVDNSPLLHEMTLRSSELLAAVQASHGSGVSSLRFSLGTVPATEPRSVFARRGPAVPPELAPEEARLVDAMVAPVSDRALATSLRRLLTKDLLTRRLHGQNHGAETSLRTQ